MLACYSLKLRWIKNMDKNRFKTKNPPLPAKKIPFHRGKITRDTMEATTMTAIMTHRTVNIVFLFAI